MKTLLVGHWIVLHSKTFGCIHSERRIQDESLLTVRIHSFQVQTESGFALHECIFPIKREILSLEPQASVSSSFSYQYGLYSKMQTASSPS
jgi:hypothetical protein